MTTIKKDFLLAGLLANKKLIDESFYYDEILKSKITTNNVYSDFIK